MSKQLKPIIHGRDHLASGADPIPGLNGCCPPETVCTSFPDMVAELAAAHTGALLGYWRLGEPSGSFADTSGNAFPANGSVTSGTAAMTRDVTGALPAGDDDGAVQVGTSTGTSSAYITTSSGGHGSRFNITGDITITAWVKLPASASSFDGGLLTTPGNGFAVRGRWPGRQVYLIRSQPAGSLATVFSATLAADTWVFIAATYDSANGHRLYQDGTLADTDAATFTLTSSPNTDPVIGYEAPNWFYGSLDEITIWQVALTAAEITELHTSGLPCVPSTADPGKVITATGTGSSTVWSYPTIEVEY